MMRLDAAALESARCNLQDTLDAAKDRAERNRLGQFATPPRLAVQITGVARAYLPTAGEMSFLDPAFGTGAFFSALLRTAQPQGVSRAIGFELDDHYYTPTSQLWARSPLRLERIDFFATSPSDQEPPVELIICNPPYVRHHHIGLARKDSLRRQVEAETGLRPSGLAGLYVYFMLHAHQWLSPGGVAAWLVPGEFLDVNYGEALRAYLSSGVSLLRIHRFEPRDIQFGDAIVSSVVIWFKRAAPEPDQPVEFSQGGDLTSPNHRRVVRAGNLAANERWSLLFHAQASEQHQGPRLGDLFKIVRGVATGANEFFVLSERTRATLEPPVQFLRPLLPPPRRLKHVEIAASEDGLPKLEDRLYLLDVGVPLETLQDKFPRLAEYLAAGAPKYSGRYLCRARDPWYAQEQREPAPLLCTYMGRVGRRGNPFKFVLNHSRAIATNVYLMLYPRPALRAVMRTDDTFLRRIWLLLDHVASNHFLQHSRVYGGGLHKFEPRELASLPLDDLRSLLPPEAFTRTEQSELFEKAGA